MKSIGIEVDPQDMIFYMIVCSVTSFTWGAWAIWRLYRDITDRGNLFLTREENGGKDVSAAPIIRFSIFTGLFSILSFFLASCNLDEFHSFSPSIYDSVYVYTAKKFIMISAGYWLAGLTSLLTSLVFRRLSV